MKKLTRPKQIKRSAKALVRGFAVVLLTSLLAQTLAPTAYAAPARKAILADIEGVVQVKIGGSDWQAAEVGMTLHELDEIRTAKGGTAEVLLDDGGLTGTIEMREASHMRLNTLMIKPSTQDKTTLVDVAMGSVMVYAKKLKGKSKFEVNTPTATIGIRGTQFEVKVQEKQPEA